MMLIVNYKLPKFKMYYEYKLDLFIPAMFCSLCIYNYVRSGILGRLEYIIRLTKPNIVLVSRLGLDFDRFRQRLNVGLLLLTSIESAHLILFLWTLYTVQCTVPIVHSVIDFICNF